MSREFAFSESNEVNAKVTNVILFCSLYSQEKNVLLFLKLFIFVKKKKKINKISFILDFCVFVFQINA